jgi:hypothetical protein
MSVRKHVIGIGGLLVVNLLCFSTANAQLGNLLNQAGSGGATGALGSLGGSSLQSLTSGSMGNVAGVLQYCIKNNFLSGASASSVKDGLMSKLPGGAATSDSGYTDGAKGILNSGDGKQVDLSGSGLKEQITKQVCDKILAQGKSLL